MFKSSFAKYLLAFTLIILLSFLILSFIITAMVRNDVRTTKESKLKTAVSTISEEINDRSITHMDANGIADTIKVLLPVLSVDYDIHILIVDDTGDIKLSSIMSDADGKPLTSDDLGSINLSKFSTVTNNEGHRLIKYSGILKGIYADESICYGREFTDINGVGGFVISFASVETEDRVVSVVRSTVINSSIWVILAALIATYFITDRIIHPLKLMTKAAKKYAKGDFTERVNVKGRDEVAALSVAFNNMADSLESLEKMRNSFLANVSHDLRTPMTTISGFIDGITSGAIPEEQHEHYLGIISTEVHRLSRLVGQLLDISRLESGDRKFDFKDFDITEMARMIIISFEKQLEEKQLDVEFLTDEDTMMAHGDKDALHQVLYNLCHNAIKFSRDKGRFFIKIMHLSSRKIRVSVYDDGQLITPEEATHLFDRFYKTDSSRGLDKSGVGLGLYISKTIIDAHGEEIHVEPHPEGCEFWFTIKSGTAVPRLKSSED